MATSGEPSPPKKRRVRHGDCYQIELNFSTEDTKKIFFRQLERIKLAVLLKKPQLLNNHELLDVLYVGHDG